MIPPKNLAKLIAKIINLYRASYVASTEAMMGTGNPLQRFLVGGINRIPTPRSAVGFSDMSKLFQRSDPEVVKKIIRGLRTMK